MTRGSELGHPSSKRKTKMKKLMFAVAAIAAGSVFADVTTANVVG